MMQKEEQDFRASDPDLVEESLFEETSARNNETGTTNVGSTPTTFVPLSINRFAHVGPRGHTPSEGTKSFMQNVSLSDLQKMTDLFYQKAFRDETLDKFLQNHNDPHGTRFAKWIHQKLSGSTLWDEDRAERRANHHNQHDGQTGFLVHDRSSAHVAAWHSPKRPTHEVGRRFKLDECRTWMRLHFWAMRESGLMEQSPAFCEYYVRFIGHFVSVYESKAPLFARDSFRWSASRDNIQHYYRNGRRMTDVLGLDFSTALSQLSFSEANDTEWPYNDKPSSSSTATSSGDEEREAWREAW